MIVRETLEVDCFELAPNMRDIDKQEIKSSGGLSPLEALLGGLKISKGYCYSLFDDNNKVVGIFGVSPVLPKEDSTGIVWLLGSDDMTNNIKEFHSLAKKYLERFHKTFNYLFNFIDDRNITTTRWLKRLGFIMSHQEKKFGVEKKPFNLFWSYRNV